MNVTIREGVLDEAGDVGHAQGSSRYLIVAVIIGDLRRLRKAVAKARKRLGKRLKDVPELKAWHTPRKIVTRLLSDAAALNIEIVAVILDKQKAKQPREPEDWYRLACSRAVQHCLEKYPKFEVTLDRRYTNPFLQGRLADALMHGAVDLNHSVAIGYAMSEQEKAIQVADAVV